MTADDALSSALRHHQAGQLADAGNLYQSILQQQPDHPDALHLLGVVALQGGRDQEAVELIERAIRISPHAASYHNNLGQALEQLGRPAAAIVAYERALQLAPNYPEARGNLGNAFKELGNLDAAIVCYQTAIALNPSFPQPHNNLGNALKDQGRLDEAISALRRAIELQPDLTAVNSNLLYTLHFQPGLSEQAIADEHRGWFERQAAPLRDPRPHLNSRDPARRLRVGYVSPDFFNQAESFFVVPLLESHNHEQFEIHAYASVARPDHVTERLRRQVDQWHAVRGWSDERLAEKIRADGIDILVDLTMHMASNRLLMFARRPAPVQVTWLAYPGSTGLSAIDYRLTDAFMEPVGADVRYSAEKLVRLPDSWCCYDPLGETPECGPLPALANGWITFGSLNNPCKHNPAVVKSWTKVLQAVRDSRLLLLCPEGSAQQRMRELFAREGLDAARIQFATPRPRARYLELYQQIDIALDPFPYNGITTTCDALWMGVPVLTVPGCRPAARAGLSLLSTAGLPDLVAQSDDLLVQRATHMAGDLDGLASMRATLRRRLRSSPLMDASRFGRHVETVYRDIWQHYAASEIKA